jgi:hypothetical protein
MILKLQNKCDINASLRGWHYTFGGFKMFRDTCLLETAIDQQEKGKWVGWQML